MASSEIGTSLSGVLSSVGGGLNTEAEIQALRREPRDRRSSGYMNGVIASVYVTDLGRQWGSRKRIRHDALRLLREGVLS